MGTDNSIQVSTRLINRPAPIQDTPDEYSLLNDEEMELPIDLARRGQSLVIMAPIVGATADDISITVNQDVLFIHKGPTAPSEKLDNYYNRECHWGPIAREVHLPLSVDPSGANATLKDGVLKIILPIIKPTSRTKVIKIR